MGWKNKYPDELLRRYLEQGGDSVADFFTDGSWYYIRREGKMHNILVSDEVPVGPICKYLGGCGDNCQNVAASYG